MRIYKCCFNEAGDWFSSIATFSDGIGKCPYCNRDSEYVKVNTISETFLALLSTVKESKDGFTLSDFFQKKLNLLKTPNEEMITSLLANLGKTFTANTRVSFIHDISSINENWKAFKDVITTKKRFTFNPEAEEYGWDVSLGLLGEIPKSTNLFRARIHDKMVTTPFSKDEMFPPNPNPTDGRAHSKGIDCLYLSRDLETPFYESRCAQLDYVSIATFSPKSPITIMDFTREFDCPFQITKELAISLLRKVELGRIIGKEMSRPLHKIDTIIEYIPTQFICEYIREKNKVEAIQYWSSMYPTGKNLVLFNRDKVEVKNVSLYKISNVTIQHEKTETS